MGVGAAGQGRVIGGPAPKMGAFQTGIDGSRRYSAVPVRFMASFAALMTSGGIA
jgi:hypothetical protein